MDDWTPLTPANPAAPAPRKCSHPKPKRSFDPVADVWSCTVAGCGHVFDPVVQRRNRNNRARGGRYELATAKTRTDGVKVGHHGGHADVLFGEMFVVQTKYYGPRFPRWMSDELAKLPRTGGRVPLLIVGEATGGHGKGRALAIVDLDDWKSLHQNDEPVP